MSKSKDMQVALLAPTTSSVLTMTDAAFVESYSQPIEDDTWIRHADIVHLDQLVETDAAAVQAKRDVLREYMEDHTRAQRARGDGAAHPDPVLEGILWQENFMQDYRATAHEHDAAVALSYRSRLVENFRQRRPSRPTTAPFGEEEVEVTGDEVASDARHEQHRHSADHGSVNAAEARAADADDVAAGGTQTEYATATTPSTADAKGVQQPQESCDNEGLSITPTLSPTRGDEL